MKSHLLETVNEIKLQGKTEKEAVRMALERFGDEKQITKGLYGLFKTQKHFAKLLLRISIAFFVIGLIMAVSLIWRDFQIQQLHQNLSEEVYGVIGEEGLISLETEKSIQSIVGKYSDDINYYALYKNQSSGELEKIIEFGEKEKENSLDIVTFRENLENWSVEYQYQEKINYSFWFDITNSLFTIFGVLFILWIIINTYHRRRLKMFL